MVAKNDITGDFIQSKPNSEQFEKNFELIFGKKQSIEKHLTESVKENEELYKNLDPITKPFPHNILRQSRIDVVGQNGNDGLHYDKAWDEMKPVGKEILPEYELDKSTGEVIKKEE